MTSMNIAFAGIYENNVAPWVGDWRAFEGLGKVIVGIIHSGRIFHIDRAKFMKPLVTSITIQGGARSYMSLTCDSAISGPQDASTVVQNFLNSLKGGVPQQQMQGQVYTTLPDLLPSSTTIPTLDSASPAQIDNLLNYLPPTILLIAQESAASIDGMVEPNAATATAAMEALSLDQKKSILKRVLRSPQFHQSLGSLTMAIRDGGLPSIAEALEIRLQNGGLVKGGSVPLGGGDAVEAFVEGAKKTVEQNK
ncbi:hypothetical protein LSUB1_G000025 [Lachnellula subtilissima]|uniref:Uncharacterized protein n=1 Tax=Lachnellula subtilissima TaxID=602034 RepID=A0A8H8UJ21_9HELO|nr:hypothetical protein LSUB1_G000025 [Lachnellula subtilissima]